MKVRWLMLVGCVTLAAPVARAAETPSWAADVAPILYKNCTTCHHPGGAGPFSLLTYADVRRWGAQVVKATRSGYMPPWLPEPDHGDFAEERRLSDEDRGRLRRWFAAGMPEGAGAPAAPNYDAEWQLGKPDLILKMAQPYTLAAGGTDVFRNFVFPYPLRGTHYVRAMEIRPGAAEVVHHANVLVDRTGNFRRQHAGDWRAGVAGMEVLLDAGNDFDPDSHFLFWKPDTPALVEPEGMPWRLDAGNDLVLNIHLKPSGRAETINAEIGLYFTDKPPEKQPMLVQLDRDDALDIPAGEKHFVVEDELTLPVDVEALGIYPHAHYLGKDMQAWAVLPGGEKRWLIWIRDWDIDRQSVYRYREPVLLPAGTVVHMRYVFDNSVENVRNPHSPPVRVRSGNRSEDEMAHLWLQLQPMHTATNAPDPRLRLEEAWMRSRLRKTPGDQVSVYNLGTALTGQGRYAEAEAVFEQDLEAHRGDARTLTALGAAQESAGDWQRALARYREAAAGSGDAATGSCDAGFNLGRLELQHDLQADAERDLRAQLMACPEDAAAVEVHELLAQLYAGSQRMDAAVAELRKAVGLATDDARTHALLSQVLGASGHLVEAIVEAQAGLRLDAKDADGWNNLGVLEARAGKTEAAREDFQRALALRPDHAEAKANLARLPVAP